MRAPDEDRLARAVLGRLSEPNDRQLFVLVRDVGAPEVVREIEAGTSSLPGLDHYRARLSGAPTPVTAAAEQDLVRGERDQVRYVVPGDLEWPSQLGDLELEAVRGHREAAPPLGLWVCGAENLRIAVLRSVAVVGARAATAYGSRVASDLGSGLAERGYAAVSGGAYGIDAAVHRGSLALGGMTISVLASGVDVPYPVGHQSLFERIAAEGLLVSELPPGSHPTKLRFLDRNRLIAALTRGTVLVEAAFRSGALSTTLWARRMQRPVLGVPGPVTSTLSAGVHRELVEGRATLVTGAADVVAAVGSMGETFAEGEAEETRQQASRSGARRPEDQLDHLARRVLDAMPVRRTLTREQLARESGLSADLVGQRVRQLRLLGLVEEVGGSWRLAAAPGLAPGLAAGRIDVGQGG